MKRFNIALDVLDVESSIDAYSQRLSRRPDLHIPGKYVLWRTDVVNLAIRKVGHEEGGAHRGHGSGDVVRNVEQSPPTRRPEPMGGVPKL